MSWLLDRLAAFDVESTGVDVENDRIVTASVQILGGGLLAEEHAWLVDPGIDIPEAVTAIHGISTEKARTEGLPAGKAVALISALLAEQVAAGRPIVAMNARFDFTILDRELQRHGLASLAGQSGGRPLLVIDPYVLDKQADPYRKGSRTLVAMAAHYGVPLTAADAHNAGADARAAARIVYKLAVKYPQLRDTDLGLLHNLQIEWAAKQAASLEGYFRRTDPAAVVEGAWPLIPRQRVTQ